MQEMLRGSTGVSFACALTTGLYRQLKDVRADPLLPTSDAQWLITHLAPVVSTKATMTDLASKGQVKSCFNCDIGGSGMPMKVKTEGKRLHRGYYVYTRVTFSSA